MRCAPVWLSMPITQSASPSRSEVKPRVRDVPITAEMVVKARTISAKYSVGPKVKASSAKAMVSVQIHPSASLNWPKR